MPRKLKKTGPSASAAAPRSTPLNFQTVSRFRIWLFRLAALLLLPVLLVVCLELVLRLAGTGYPVSFFLKRQVNGRTVLTENEKFGWRFFGPALARTPRPVELPVVKPPGTRRVFVFGESAAYGDPKPEFGLPRMLEVLLRDKYPETRFEVINVAMTGINSNVILPIARDCASKEGDVWVIYMGNNEVVGPFGSGTVFGGQTPGLAMIRANLFLRATRIGQFFGSALAGLRNNSAEQGEWQGMAMFTNNQIRLDDPCMARVYSHFKRNLADIVSTGRRHGARIVVSTVASNLKDCAPFGSLHRAGMDAAALTQWNDVFQKGIQLALAGNDAQAVKQFQTASALDDHYAELHFRWARCLLALGQSAQASAHYARARDEDTLRFRTDSRLNQIVRDTVTGLNDPNIRFIDAEQELTSASPQGIPGESLFLEHVHLTFEGNYRLARLLADGIAGMITDKAHTGAAAGRPWLPQSECARRLAWTGWDEYRTYSSVMFRLNEPPFTEQCDHQERYSALRQHLETLLPQQNPQGLQLALHKYQEAIGLSPDDWVIQRNLSTLLLKTGDPAGAEAAMRRSVELLPHDLNGHLELGLLLVQAHRALEAETEFEQVLSQDPRSVPALNGLALAQNALGHPDQAIATLKHALRLKPASPDSHLNLGTALDAAGLKDDAREQFRNALHDRISSPDLMVRLGKICMVQGWTDEGIASFEKAVSFDPVNPSTHWYLGGALDTKKRFADALQHFSEAVRLDPQFANGHLSRGIELSRLGKETEAADAFSNALNADPHLLEARLRLGVSFAHQRRLVEAREQFERVLQVQPTNSIAQKYMQSILKNPQGP